VPVIRRCLQCGAFTDRGSWCATCQPVSPSNRLAHLPAYRQARRVREALAGYRCERCGAADVPLQAHHRHRAADGGENSVANLMMLCENCHRLIHHPRP
jgi:5-methylcytosine-specific restriction endonuclease McrA